MTFSTWCIFFVLVTTLSIGGVNRLLDLIYRHTGETSSVRRGGAPLPRLPSARAWAKPMLGGHFGHLYQFIFVAPAKRVRLSGRVSRAPGAHE